MEIEKINVRGVNISNVDIDEATEFIKENLKVGIQTAVYTPNAEIVQLCINDADFCKLINSAELVVPDGVGVVKAARILGTPLKGKVAGI